MNFIRIYEIIDSSKKYYYDKKSNVIVSDLSLLSSEYIELPKLPNNVFLYSQLPLLKKIEFESKNAKDIDMAKGLVSRILNMINNDNISNINDKDVLNLGNDIYFFLEKRDLEQEYDFLLYKEGIEFYRKWFEKNEIGYDRQSYIDCCKKNIYINYGVYKNVDFNLFLDYKEILGIHLPTVGKYYINNYENKLEIEFIGHVDFNITDISFIDDSIEKNINWINIDEVNKNVLSKLPKYMEFEKWAAHCKILIYNDTLKKYNYCTDEQCVLFVFRHLMNGQDGITVEKILIS